MRSLLGSMSAEQRASVVRSVTISAAFAITSMMTSFTFKAIFSSYKFEASFTLLGCQMALTLLFCRFLKAACKGVPGLEVPDLDPAVARRGVFAGLLFVVNIAVGFAGLRRVNIPMFLTVRRTTTVFTLAAEYLMLGKVASGTVQFGIALTVLGALIAGYDSLGADLVGYMWTLGNNAATAASWSATKRFSDECRVKGFGLTFYNALVALPMCVAGAVLTGEVAYLASYPHLTSPDFLAALLAASALGVGMNYVVFLCTTSTSPLATAVTGNVKDILATVLGAWLFGDFVPTAPRILGILVSFLGSGVFSAAKLAEAKGAIGSSQGAEEREKEKEKEKGLQTGGGDGGGGPGGGSGKSRAANV